MDDETSDIPAAPSSRPDLKKTWQLIASLEKNSDVNYQRAGDRIAKYVGSFNEIGLSDLADIHQFINDELKQLETTQNDLLYKGIFKAVVFARLAFPHTAVNEQAESMMVQYLVNSPLRDGLNLSARLWRIHAGAAQDMKAVVDVAVQQGWDTFKATRHAMTQSDGLIAALKEAGGGDIAKRLGDLLVRSDKSSPVMKFKRVLRTEINRAHGMRYIQMVREDPEAKGLRFRLSPRHPRKDICDTHAAADLYDMGPGVYPIDACPWPAHPNTFSYVEAVYNLKSSG